MPLLFAIVATVLVISLWQQMRQQEQAHVQQLLEQEATTIETTLNQELSTRILTLERMASRWQVSGGIPKLDANNYVQDQAGYQAIEWVDSSLKVRWLVPQSGNEVAQNFDLGQEPRHREAATTARTLRQTTLTQTVDLVQGGQGFLAFVPIPVKSQTSKASTERFDGFIVGVFRYYPLFDSILKPSFWHRVQIYDRNGLLYSQGNPTKTIAPKTLVFHAYNAQWLIKVFPTPELIAEGRSHLPTILLITGLGCAWFMALVLYRGQRAERHSYQAKLVNQQLQAEIEHRLQIEASLRQGEERWQLALCGSNDGIWDWDIGTNRVFFSTRWKAMLGYGADEIGDHLDEWQQRLHPADLEATTSALLNHLTHKTPFYVSEHRIQCQDGSYKWVLDRGQAVWDESGNPTRMVGSYTDITERRQAEDDLREMAAVMEHVVMGISKLDRQGRYLYVNHAYAALIGYSAQEMPGMDWQTTVHPADLDKLTIAYQEMVRDGRVEVEARGVRRDGSVFDKSLHMIALYDDQHQVVGHYCFMKDISERVKTEAALQMELLRSKALMETSIDGIVVLNSQGKVVQTSPSFARMLGYSVEETLALNVTGWDAQWSEAELLHILAGEMPLTPIFETCHRRKDGSLYDAEISYSRMEVADEVLHFCICRDVTDRKRTEMALHHSQARLAGILEIASDAIISVNARQQIVLFNQGAERIFGYRATEVLGQPLAMLLPDRFARIHHQHVEHYGQQVSPARQMAQRGAIYGRRKDGSEFPAEASISQLTLNGEIIYTTFLRDISERVQVETQRQQAEEELRQSEEKFRMAIDFTYNWEYWQAPDGSLIYMSPSCERVTGYSPTDFIENPNLLYAIVHPDDLPQVNGHLCINESGQGFVDFRIITRCGETRWIGHSCQTVYDSAGRFLGTRVSNRDISDRKQAEFALRQSEATKQAIIQAFPDLLIRMRFDGSHVEFISSTPFNIFKPAQLRSPNISIYEILSPPLADQRLHYAQIALKSNTIQTYEQELLIDGIPCHEEVRIVPLLEDEVLVMVRDVTERTRLAVQRQQTEEELRHQKAMFQAIVDHIPVMIVLFDATGQIQFVNPELERVLGWSLADWQQRDILALSYPDEAYRATVLQHMLAASGNWQDLTTTTATGQQLMTSWANVQLSSGQFLGIGQDISDRKHKEIVLQQAMEAAEAANLAKSMFLANMSHELRTPLNVILGFAQVMSHDSSLNASQRADLQTIRRSGDHLLSLINDILDLSKIEAGHSTLEVKAFDLVALLHTLRTMMAERANAKQLQLTFDIAADVPQYVIADEQKLRQILLNLLSNAIKFTGQGSVSLRVGRAVFEAGNPEASPDDRASLPPSDAVTLYFQVSDTGVGIAPVEQELIFDAFAQAEAGRKSVSGTGLGLTISRKLAHLMQGSLSVESCPQVGSTFTLTLPLHSTSNVDVPAAVSHRSIIGLVPGHAHCRILVVDDQSENRHLLVRLLTNLGLEVREATNGQEAVQIWQEWQPDLTWMDIRMPILDGYEATRQIRNLEKARSHPPDSAASLVQLSEETDLPLSVIIALTAQASQSDRTLALNAGCNDYISKPFLEETLLLKMAEYLGLQYRYSELLGDADNCYPGLITAPSDVAFSHLSNLGTLPKEWLHSLEKAAVCGNDRVILDLVSQLSPEFRQLATALSSLASQFRFEDILALLHRIPPT